MSQHTDLDSALPLLLRCRYVSGRTRAPREINGKSGNLNNALQNIIYNEYKGRLTEIPANEVVVVFDADMACKKEFFLKVLEVMCDQETALCLTPQVRTSLVLPAAGNLHYVRQCLVPVNSSIIAAAAQLGVQCAATAS